MEANTGHSAGVMATTPSPVHYEIDMVKKPSKKRSLWSRLFKTSSYKKSSGSRRTVATTASSCRGGFLISDVDSTFSESFVEEDDEHEEGAVTDGVGAVVVADEPKRQSLALTCIDDDSNACSSSLPVQPLSIQDDDDNVESSVIREDMLERADEARSAGEYSQSLALYERVLLEYPIDDPVESANLCYACTKLCGLLQDFERAYRYAKMELQYTLQIAGGDESLAVARCYHELARISKYGLGEIASALGYYKAALAIEQACLRKANNNKKTTSKKQRDDIQEAEHYIRETKECIGRTQFELGNLDDALRMLL